MHIFQPGAVCIKTDDFSKSVFSSSMADSLPTSLDDYCKVFRVSFFDVRLQCVFCKRFLCLQELADFHVKHLSLIWKGCSCYSSCSNCLKLIARYEFENHCQCTVKSDLFEDVVNKKLKDVIVRCLYCYKLLDFIEKFDCCCRGLDFSLVRGHWRNCCRICIRQI